MGRSLRARSTDTYTSSTLPDAMAKRIPETENGPDPKAREILFRRYWSSKGWTTRSISEAEFDYAKQAGLMFDPIDLSHDEIVERAIRARSRVAPAAVGRADRPPASGP